MILSFTNTLNASNWIDIAGILVNGAIAITIIIILQKKFQNQRVLKDHCINEVKNIKCIYKDKLDQIQAGKCYPKELLPWFKLINIEVDALAMLLQKKYNIRTNILSPFQIELRNLITDDDDYILQFNSGKKLILAHKSKIKLVQFQQRNSKLFNELIVQINDAS